MRATKDSGFEWIGIIPAEWGLSKIGQVYRLRNTKVSDTDYPPLSVTNKGIVPQLDTAAKTNAHDDRKLVKKGDFAINSRSDRRGSCGISDYDGSVSLINTILAPLNEMNPGYYDWLFHTVQFGDEFYKFGHGIVDDLWTTGWQEMKKITIPTPPLPEQKRIADFLDAKCAEIDALTDDIQTQIDTLEQYKQSVITETVTKGLNPDVEMKDSGNQYWGKIPTNWYLSDIKYLFEIVKRIAGKEGYDILSVTQKGIKIKDISNNEGQVAESYANYQFVYPGDFVMNHMDLLTGWVDCSKLFGVTSPDYRVFKLRNKNNSLNYYKYIMQTCYMNRIFYSLGQGVSYLGRWRLQTSSFNNFMVPVPPVEVQESIANYLDKKCTEINACIDDKQRQLEILAEYKKTLIFEYVTGKKEV